MSLFLGCETKLTRPGAFARPELDAWLAPYRELWERSLDRLERHLDDLPE